MTLLNALRALSVGVLITTLSLACHNSHDRVMLGYLQQPGLGGFERQSPTYAAGFRVYSKATKQAPEGQRIGPGTVAQDQWLLPEHSESGTEDTVLFTERNPFFASAGDEVRKQQLKARKSSKKKTKKDHLAESVDTHPKNVPKSDECAQDAPAPSATKRLRKDTNGAEPQDSNNCSKCTTEDASAPRAEKGDKQAIGSQPTGKKRDRLQPESKQQKKAARIETLELKSEDAENGDSDVGEARAEVQPAEPEEDVLKRTVFVGNLPQGTESKEVKILFKRFGRIESARIRSLAASADVKMSKALQVKAGKTDSSKGSVHAYVVFDSEETAKAAHDLNMTEFKGNHIRVDRAVAPKEDKSAGHVHYDARRSVFVGNLPRDVSEEDLIRIFNSGDDHPALEGTVEAVRVVRDPHCRIGKGIAYILFRTKVAAMAALRKNGSDCGGREMRVMKVQAPGKNGSKQALNKKQSPGGVHKKSKKKDSGPARSKSASTTQPVKKPKTRDSKRPAVAARKKAALAARS